MDFSEIRADRTSAGDTLGTPQPKKTGSENVAINLTEQAIRSVKDASSSKASLPVPKEPIKPSNVVKSKLADVQHMAKQVTNKGADFAIEAPTVRISHELDAELSPDQKAQLKQESLQDFKNAQMKMEHSIMEVALQHPDAMRMAENLDRRVFEFIEKYAEVLLEEEGRIGPGSTPESRAAQIDLKVNSILVELFSDKEKADKTGIQEGFRIEGGNIGNNPLAIRNAIKNGNLRERMYIPYRTIWGFTNDLLASPEIVNKVNAKLQDWKIDMTLYNGIKETAKEENLGSPYPYMYGTYAAKVKPEKLRVAHTPEQRVQIAKKENRPITDASGAETARKIPLSDREKRFITGELPPEKRSLDAATAKSYADKAKDENYKPQWQSGAAWFEAPKSDTVDHPYVKGQEALGLPGIAGISGTLDQLMTTAMFFGLTNQQDLEQVRLACLGWLIEAQDHSYHEIMTASKSFGLEYTPSATSYKQIYSNDPDFESKLKEAQHNQNMELPDYYLSEEYTKKKAVALGMMPPTNRLR